MKPADLYKRTPEKTGHEIGILKGCYYDHVPEIPFELPFEDKTKKVKILYYKDFDFDGRRFWRLAGVYFDDRPVMIIQNAGREGDDHRKRFITDQTAYLDMLRHIMTLGEPSKHEVPDIVDPETDIAGLDDFYGNRLDGYFERY